MGMSPDADVDTSHMHCLAQARPALIDGGAIAALLRVIVGAAEHEPESANSPTLTQMRRAQVCQLHSGSPGTPGTPGTLLALTFAQTRPIRREVVYALLCSSSSRRSAHSALWCRTPASSAASSR